MRIRLSLLVLVVVAGAAWPSAQPVFTGPEIFPLEEFAARRQRVMAAVGDGVAILQGTTERPGEQPLRQSNQFFYLTGVVEPRAIAVIDGAARTATLFLLPLDDRRERQIDRMYGVGLVPGRAAAEETGFDAVLPRDQFAALARSLARRTIYAPMRPEVLGSASSSDPAALAKATKTDPWDGRSSREEAFVAHLQASAAGATIKDLDPIVDALRTIKSPREIAVIREATRLAGDGIIAAMRRAAPGTIEYQLQAEAEYVFKRGGAYGPAYFALVATGRNTFYSHYHKNTAVLAAGDLVQFDYAPDYKYYTSDVTRVFPADGTFTARQREYYGAYLKLYQALMSSIRVHATPAAVAADAVTRMDRVLASYPFTDAAIEAAARRFVDGYRNRTGMKSLGHMVGMEVHDVTAGLPSTLEPGQVFTIEPAMQLPDEHLGIRLEDMILITDAGYENLSAFVPIEIPDIERTMGAGAR